MANSRDALRSDLDGIMADVRASFDAKHAAREHALLACRQITQLSANCIRAIHRQEFDAATEMLATAKDQTRQAQKCLSEFTDIYHAGFLHDASKEYVEATATLALVTGAPIPTPASLGVEYAAYLNGLAEAASELRRFALDALRREDRDRPEELLGAMDEIYAVLVTVDYPDAITKGLRRTTDVVRGVIERTRADLTVIAMQQRLQDDIQALTMALVEESDDPPRSN